MHWTKKRVLPLHALSGADLALDLGFRYWTGLRDQGLLPSRSQVDTPQFRLLIPAVHWIDLRPPLHDAEPRLALGPLEAFVDLMPASGDDSEDRKLGHLLREDLRTVAFTGSPLFQEIHLRNHQQELVYSELLLPVADDGMEVTEILMLVREQRGLPVSERLAASS